MKPDDHSIGNLLIELLNFWGEVILGLKGGGGGRLIIRGEGDESCTYVRLMRSF